MPETITIEAAALSLCDLMSARTKHLSPNAFSVGHDQIDVIYLYEHVRGISRLVPKEFNGFRVKRQYVGKVRPLNK